MKKKDWFLDWFDTEWYHKLYKHRDDKEAKRFMDNLIDYLPTQNNQKILDLACGKGRHAYYLAQKGFDVVGVDLSKESIDVAQANAHDMLHFGVHDMRELYKKGEFDYVFNLFTSFGYFETDREHIQVLENMKAALSSTKGRIILDFLNADLVASGLRPNEIVTDGETTFNISRKIIDGFVHKSIVVEEKGKKINFSERVRLYRLADFERLFAQAGLEIKQVFGDYDLGVHNSTSPRLILVGMEKRCNGVTV